MSAFLAAILLASVPAVVGSGVRRAPLGFSSTAPSFTPPNQHPGVNNCTEHWYQNTLDHFSWKASSEGPHTYNQRYFVCDQHWSGAAAGGPIFFYTGNEANVELYVNATGLMWESAEEFGAVLIFAEHRYYGKSQPSHDTGSSNPLEYLSSEQALADYAELLTFIKTDMKLKQSTPVIAFGGSYGGMLASWMRMKYPSSINGAIAGSAPIWSFLGEDPAIDTGSYASIVTRDLTPAAGAEPGCADNLRDAWQEALKIAWTDEGKARIREAMRLCPGQEVDTWDDVYDVLFWLQSAFDYMAMGNYPYPFSYILNGDGILPAYPMRVACKKLLPPEDESEPSDPSSGEKSWKLEGLDLLAGLRDAAGVFYNHTGELTCFNYTSGVNNATAADANQWGYQYCTEMFQPMSRDGVHDAFWSQPFNESVAVQQCLVNSQVITRPMQATFEYGGKDIASSSNIVFSNGFLDPWSGSGVLQSVSDSVIALEIKEGAHHLDLFWSHPGDPQSVIDARNEERRYIKQWIAEADTATAAKAGGQRHSGPFKSHRKFVIES